MVYPSAPWTLTGFSVQTLNWVDSDCSRANIPPTLQLLELWPGKTLAVVYLSQYQSGSVLEYNELIVALPVRQRLQLGGWITHIYVDLPASVAGGREIWGLPKEMAQFTWFDGGCTVQQADLPLCTLTYPQPRPLWRQPLVAPVFSQVQQQLVNFTAQANARLSLVASELTVPTSSPLSALQLSQPILSTYFADLQLRVMAPERVSTAIDSQ